MRRELRDRWVAALRSGEYEQGRAQLKQDDRDAFCCLGVLCDVVGTDWTPEYETEGGTASAGFYLGGPLSVLDDLTPKLRVHLVNLNDDHLWDFVAIADEIETVVPVE